MAGEREQRNVLIAGGMLALHVVVLSPLALRQAKTEKTDAPVVLDVILKRPMRVASHLAAAEPTVTAAAPEESKAWPQMGPARPADALVEAPSTAPAAVDDRWRVRPDFARTGDGLAPRRMGGDCLNILEDRPQCRIFGAPLRTIDAEMPDEAAASRARTADRRRDDGFERQVRANEAWRDYTRGDGAYPGLRSLFSAR